MRRPLIVLGLIAATSACTTTSESPDTTSGGAGSTSGGAGSTSGGAGSTLGGAGSMSGGAGSTPGGAGSMSGGAGSTSGGAGGASAFALTSPAFQNVDGCSVETPKACDVFPDENVSYEGKPNRSPELHWSGAPAGAKSFALVLFDVTFGQAHWAIWNLPEGTTTLAADVPQDTATPATPAGSRQANANFATTSTDGYFGPHVPCNVFELQLYALSLSSFTPKDPESAVLVSIELQDLGEPVLGVAKLTGRSNDYVTTCE